MKVVFDLETAKNPLAKSIIDELKLKPDSRLKDSEKIKASIQQKKDTKLDKAALFWGTGCVVHISATELHGEVKFSRSMADCGGESGLLSEFSIFIQGATDLMGQNIKDFDIPYLIGRSIFHRLKVPFVLKNRSAHRDLYDTFGNPRYSSQACSLDMIANSLGIDSKVMDSALIPALAEAGNWELIKEHCDQDVEITAEVFRRLGL